MAIANAVQRGKVVYVYDEKRHTLFTQSAGNDPADGLKGYTSGTVNIRRGNFIYTYNEKGHQINAKNAR